MVRYKSSRKLKRKSPAKKFTELFTKENIHTSIVFPAEDLRFQIETKDLEKKTVTISILGNLVSKSFKRVKATFTITPTEDMTPNRMEWIFESEKISNDIKDPVWIADTLVGYIKSLDFVDKLQE